MSEQISGSSEPVPENLPPEPGTVSEMGFPDPGDLPSDEGDPDDPGEEDQDDDEDGE